MHPETREELGIRLKLAVIEYADHFGVTEACREFNVPRSSFYRWKRKYDQEGCSGLYRERPIAYRHPRRTSPDVVEKILTIRAEDQLGALRINSFFLLRHMSVLARAVDKPITWNIDIAL